MLGIFRQRYEVKEGWLNQDLSTYLRVSLINFAYESAIRSTFLSRLRPLRGVKIKKSLSLENIFPDQLKVMFS